MDDDSVIGPDRPVTPRRRLDELHVAFRSAFLWAVTLGDDDERRAASAVRVEVVGDVVQLWQGEDLAIEMTRREYLDVLRDWAVRPR